MDYLAHGEIVTHDFVLGELALGVFPSKKLKESFFERLYAIERLPTSDNDSVMDFIESQNLAGKGLGFVDCHLLHSAYSNNAKLESLDKSLTKAFAKLT